MLTKQLSSGKVLARNTGYNLIGQIVPIAVAFFSIPFLIRGMGSARFGVLNLLLVVIGYFSLFDLGLGRALTQIVAEKLGEGKVEEIPQLVWTSLFLMTILGLIGVLVVGLVSYRLVYKVLKIPFELQPESLNSFYLIAASIPFVINTACLRGILSAFQRFDLITLVQIPMGVFTFAGPLLVLPFTHNLFAVVAVLVIGRVVAWVVHLVLCFRVMPGLRRIIALHRAAVKPLLYSGSWMTVSNIIGPLMTQLDRFLIGSLVTMTAVAYYATPYEAITKVWLIPGAMAGVLFPAFSTSNFQGPNRLALLFVRGVKYTFLALYPVILVIITFAHEGLSLWLGAEFARNSFHVLQWLAVGVFINSIGFIPFALVQGVGRPDLTAKLHLLELPFYLLAVWWLIRVYSIEGAAIAWVIRASVDTVVLFVIAARFMPNFSSTIPRMVLIMGAALIIFVLALLPPGVILKALFFVVVFLNSAFVAWRIMLDSEERSLVQDRLKMPIFPKNQFGPYDCFRKRD